MRLVGAVGAASVVVPYLAVPLVARAATSGAPSTLAAFTPYVGTKFTFLLPGNRAAQFTLTEATAGPAAQSDGRPVTGEAFSLLFSGSSPVPITGAVYPVRHQALGAFAMFVSPVERAVNGQHYEAVYSSVAPAR